MEENILTKKVMHIFMWNKDDDLLCPYKYTTKEYVFAKFPSIEYIQKLIGEKNIWILIGKNPSKATGSIMDETNVYLRNKLMQKKNADGYILLNLFPDIQTTYNIAFKNTDTNNLRDINKILEQFVQNNVLIFYGCDVVTKLGRVNKFKSVSELHELFDILEKKDNVYYTGTSNYFGHPASRYLKGNWDIYKLDSESKLQWRPF